MFEKKKSKKNYLTTSAFKDKYLYLHISFCFPAFFFWVFCSLFVVFIPFSPHRFLNLTSLNLPLPPTHTHTNHLPPPTLDHYELP